MKVKHESELAQSCPTLGDPMDCSSPGSSVHGIFQARVLEWGAIAFSRLWVQTLQMQVWVVTVLLTNWLKSKDPMIRSLGSINLLEYLTKCREIFYLVGYQFTTKSHNSR